MPFITYRTATLLDAPDLLRWKNDPETRRFAIETHDEIPFERHVRWMDWMLSNPNVIVFIIEADGVPCGDIRGEVHYRFVEIAIKMDPKFRGKGIGSTALIEVGDMIQKEFNKMLLAKIVYGNVASMRLFENCGYRVIGHGEGYYLCSKDYTPTSE